LGIADKNGGKHIRLHLPELFKGHHLCLLPLAADTLHKPADRFGRFVPKENIAGFLQIAAPPFTGWIIQGDNK
jgi:hypothetical protein